MKIKCPVCSEYLESDEANPDQALECKSCNNLVLPPTDSSGALSIQQTPAPMPPMVVPMSMPPALVAEECLDRREARADRREQREMRRDAYVEKKEDRQANYTGVAGLAINSCCAAFLLAGIASPGNHNLLLNISLILTPLGVAAGIILSIIGVFMPSRNQQPAIYGIAVGALAMIALMIGFSR